MIDVEKEMPGTITASAQFVNSMVGLANVQAVFGRPVERGETLLIPCCEVSMGGGLGIGSGPSAGSEQRKVSIGQGAGGGGSAMSRPIAVVVLSPQGVRVQPIMDMTKVVLAAFATAIFLLSWLGRLSRAARSGGEKEPSLAQVRHDDNRSGAAMARAHPALNPQTTGEEAHQIHVCIAEPAGALVFTTGAFTNHTSPACSSFQ